MDCIRTFCPVALKLQVKGSSSSQTPGNKQLAANRCKADPTATVTVGSTTNTYLSVCYSRCRGKGKIDSSGAVGTFSPYGAAIAIGIAVTLVDWIGCGGPSRTWVRRRRGRRLRGSRVGRNRSGRRLWRRWLRRTIRRCLLCWPSQTRALSWTCPL